MSLPDSAGDDIEFVPATWDEATDDLGLDVVSGVPTDHHHWKPAHGDRPTVAGPIKAVAIWRRRPNHLLDGLCLSVQEPDRLTFVPGQHVLLENELRSIVPVPGDFIEIEFLGKKRLRRGRCYAYKVRITRSAES